MCNEEKIKRVEMLGFKTKTVCGELCVEIIKDNYYIFIDKFIEDNLG